MAKKTLNQKQTEVATDTERGLHLEQTITVEDNILPSPGELQAYKSIDPTLVETLINMAVKEQEFRHQQEIEKLQVIERGDIRKSKINFAGMLFAFLVTASFVAAAIVALYLDRAWFAGFFTLSAIMSIASIFTEAGKMHQKK